MIIWDTGEYEILPYQMESAMPETETDDSRSVSSESSYPGQEQRSDSEKLKEAFRNVCSCSIHWGCILYTPLE